MQAKLTAHPLNSALINATLAKEVSLMTIGPFVPLLTFLAVFPTIALGSNGCFRARLTELKIKSSERRIAQQKRPLPEIQKDMASVLKQKGLNQADADHFVEKLFLADVVDPNAALEVLKNLTPERLKTEYGSKVLPYTVRQMVNFYGPENLDIKRAVELIQDWSDMELAGLAKAYSRGIHLSKGAKHPEARIAALEDAFREEGIPEKIAKKLVECASAGR